MSVHFGRLNFDGVPSDQDYLQKVRNVLAPYGPDGVAGYSKGGLDILRCAFHTTRESRLETQPHVLPAGAVITWDGRLDNRAELIGRFSDALSSRSSDVAIVAIAYERRGLDCLAELTGDWALSIWNPGDRSVILAKDPIGVRHLYYSLHGERLTWSSILDPLVLLSGKYICAGRTIPRRLVSILPRCPSVALRGDSFCPTIVFRNDKGRKKHDTQVLGFRSRKENPLPQGRRVRRAFSICLRRIRARRMRSDVRIVAELSGGIDSSSIVCMADRIIASGGGESPRLDTLSYYDDSEPDWNERPYFSQIEQGRGHVGYHIDVSSRNAFLCDFETHRFAAAPSSGGRPSEPAKHFIHCMASPGSRVLLSGIGGDEVTGGVPTPVPQLADLLARARFSSFAHQLSLWAIHKRKPWFQLLLEVTRGFLPHALVGVPKHRQPAPWLRPTFVNAIETFSWAAGQG